MHQAGHSSAIVRWLGPLLACLWLAAAPGCNAPRAQLAEYRRCFDAVRASSERYFLEGKLDARRLSESPHLSDSPRERTRTLAEREEVLDARLDALNAIAAYNDALTGLVTKGNAAEITASFESFAAALRRLAPGLSKFAGPAAPAVEGVAAIVAAIEDAARQRRFRVAVAEAEKVLPALFDLLAADIESLTQVREALALAEQSDAQRRVLKSTARAANLLNGYAAAPAVQAHFGRINAARARITVPAPLPPLPHSPRADAAPDWPADGVEAAVVSAEIDAAEAAAADWERVQERLRRAEELRLAYVKQITATKEAFAVLVEASRNPSVNVHHVADLAAGAIREFREARLALDEVR